MRSVQRLPHRGPPPRLPRVTADASFLARLRETDNIAFAEQWQRWRGDRLLPRRVELDLSSIRRLLGSVMLFELHSEDVALVKVAGTALREHYGYELTGKNYVELAPPARRATRCFRMWQSVVRPCGSRLIREHKVPSGRVTHAEVVTLPLEADRNDAPRLLLTHVAPFTVLYEGGGQAQLPGTFDIAEDFVFLDIGAGVPDSIVPVA
jgi:hypothetical protein